LIRINKKNYKLKNNYFYKNQDNKIKIKIAKENQ